MCPCLEPRWSFTCERRAGGFRGAGRLSEGEPTLLSPALPPPSPSSLHLGGCQSGRNVPSMQEAQVHLPALKEKPSVMTEQSPGLRMGFPTSRRRAPLCSQDEFFSFISVRFGGYRLSRRGGSRVSGGQGLPAVCPLPCPTLCPACPPDCPANACGQQWVGICPELFPSPVLPSGLHQERTGWRCWARGESWEQRQLSAAA